MTSQCRVLLEERYHWCGAMERNLFSKQKFFPHFMPPFPGVPKMFQFVVRRKMRSRRFMG